MKNKILITINYIAAILALFSACLVDSDSWVPFVIFVICASWLALFAYANGYLEAKDETDG